MKDSESKSVLLHGARLVLPAGVSSGKSVSVEQGRIARIDVESNSLRPSVTKSQSLYGLTLYPGFVDIHIHGANGIDVMQATAADLCRVAEFLARAGVTAWLPTFVPAPDSDPPWI